jgi:DNA-binding NtrC family response regulator
MEQVVREGLLHRSVGELAAFTQAAYRLGLSLWGEEDGRCVCALAPGAADATEPCRAFLSSVFATGASRLRCPGGLSVVARPVQFSAAGRLLLASHGFLEDGDPAPKAAPAGAGRKGGAIPSLSAAEVGQLERFLGMGAGLMSTLARADRELAHEAGREDAWLLQAGAPSIVGVSPGIVALREALPTLANSREPLFIDGEPGTGRTLAAAAVHRLGPRRAGPFIAEDLGRLPEALQESELFGSSRTPGLLRDAAGGTLFLARVERLTPASQERLAALLGTAGAGGGSDVRFIASSGVELDAAVERGRFRRDLAARLRSLAVALPPLRERPEDLPLLVEHLLHRLAARLGTAPPTVTPEALESLKMHRWTGNVRELEDELERAAAGRSVLRIEDLSAPVARSSRAPKAAGSDLRTVIGEVEVELITRTLGETGWNKSRAARLLGLSRLGLQKKMDRYGIDRRR